MKNCKLVSSMNSKGFGLDEVTLLVDYNEYRYKVDAATRIKIERINKVGKRPFDMVNIAKKHGILIKEGDFFTSGFRLYSCDDEDSLSKELNRTFNKHHG